MRRMTRLSRCDLIGSFWIGYWTRTILPFLVEKSARAEKLFSSQALFRSCWSFQWHHMIFISRRSLPSSHGVVDDRILFSVSSLRTSRPPLLSCWGSFLTFETAADKTVSPEGPFSNCSGAFWRNKCHGWCPLSSHKDHVMWLKFPQHLQN